MNKLYGHGREFVTVFLLCCTINGANLFSYMDKAVIDMVKYIV